MSPAHFATSAPSSWEAPMLGAPKEEQPVTITPNGNGLPGVGELETIVGALLTVGLIASGAGLVLSAGVWAVGTAAANGGVVAAHKWFALQAAGASAEAGLGPGGWPKRQVVSALVAPWCPRGNSTGVAPADQELAI